MPPFARNVFVKHSARRLHREYGKAIQLVKNGMSFRDAAEEYFMSASTLHYQFHNGNNENWVRATSRTSLTPQEEKEVVEILLRHARNGRWLTRNDLMDTVEMKVKSLPPWRQASMRFRNGRPGRKFCELFEARHSNEIMFRHPARQDSKRFRATNAEVLVKHMKTIKTLIEHYNLDPSRIVNVDETGFSPATDDKFGTQPKLYMEKGATNEVPRPEFQNVNRVTLLATIFADGSAGRPMFVYQGTRLRVRRVTRNADSSTQSQCISEMLPRGSLLTARKETASVDSSNFMKWAEQFVDDTVDLRQGQRHLLLIYDGYRSHLSIPVLELLASHNIVAYALPAHTSGTTQPLDLSIFPSMKHHFRNILEKVFRARKRERETLDEFAVTKIITEAYQKSMSFENVKSGFAAAGIYPFDDCRLYGQARPYSFAEPFRIASLDEMMKMMDDLTDKSVAEVVDNVHIHFSGFLDTTYGTVLTTEAALGLLRLHDQQRALADQTAKLKAAEKDKKEQLEVERRKLVRKQQELSDATRRVRMYGEAVHLPRPMEVRRAIAKERAAAKKLVHA